MDNTRSGRMYNEAWTNDETDHWHAATCEHTDEVKDKAAHTWNSDKVCTVCAFRNCGLTDIVIPKSVKYMGSYVFSWCESLTNIWCEAGSHPYDWSSLWYSTASNATVHWGGTWEYVNGVPTLKT